MMSFPSSGSSRGSTHQRSNSVWMTNYGDDEATFAQISGTKHRKRFDEAALARLGKKQELKRRFGFLSVFGLSCCILITWESAMVLLSEGFMNGGPAGVIWGYIFSWVGSTSVYLCLAEMASIAPIAGGQYFWVAILGPPQSKRFLSYITGWLTCLAWIALIGTGIIQVGTLIQGILVLDYPSYEKDSYQGTLLSWAVIAVALFINTFLAGILPFLEGTILIFHILGYVAVMVTMLYLSPKAAARDVFFKTLNLGGWSTQALSLCVGSTGNVVAFAGADAAVHMAEEIENASEDVPRAIFTTLLLNGSMGFGAVLAILFCVTDIPSVINTKTDCIFIQIIANGCGEVVATTLTSIIIALIWCAVIGYLATASRMMWSFARDKALPFHQVIRKVHESTSIPLYAVLIATVIPCLLALIYVGSPVAYSDVLSMTVSGLYASYLIPSSLLLWRRATGQISDFNANRYSASAPENHNLLSKRNRSIRSRPSLTPSDRVIDFSLMWGPWRIPGIWGTLNNAFACAYCCFVFFWSFWPQYAHPNGGHMNYAIASFLATILFSVVYYFVYGHKEYKGPLVEMGMRG